MQWDLNSGRYTTVLRGGIVAHAAKVDGGWEVLVPALWFCEVVRNPRLKTWLTAQSVVERVLLARLDWNDPHHR